MEDGEREREEGRPTLRETRGAVVHLAAVHDEV